MQNLNYNAILSSINHYIQKPFPLHSTSKGEHYFDTNVWEKIIEQINIICKSTWFLKLKLALDNLTQSLPGFASARDRLIHSTLEGRSLAVNVF